VIACSDDPGARAVAQRIGERRTDVTVQLYGTSVNGVGNIAIGNPERGALPFTVTLSDGAVAAALHVPGRHMALNAAGAILALQALWPGTPIDHDALRAALARFRGTRRRSEVLGEWNDVLYVDDYAHHPAAIRTTLAGYRAFWPGRRIVVDFMSHTYSRTAALLDGFAGAFSDADIVLLNDIYASARETPIAGISGERLAAAIAAQHPAVEYHPSFDEAVARARTLLQPGDLFVTMGAGNNSEVGARLIAEHKKGSHDA
jgi:UDP-N-acetylmuramate--alanine ligase